MRCNFNGVLPPALLHSLLLDSMRVCKLSQSSTFIIIIRLTTKLFSFVIKYFGEIRTKKTSSKHSVDDYDTTRLAEPMMMMIANTWKLRKFLRAVFLLLPSASLSSSFNETLQWRYFSCMRLSEIMCRKITAKSTYKESLGTHTHTHRYRERNSPGKFSKTLTSIHEAQPWMAMRDFLFPSFFSFSEYK